MELFSALTYGVERIRPWAVHAAHYTADWHVRHSVTTNATAGVAAAVDTAAAAVTVAFPCCYSLFLLMLMITDN